MWAEPVHLSDKYHNVPKYYLDTDHCCMLSEVDEFNNAIIDIVNDQYLPRALAMIEQFKSTN